MYEYCITFSKLYFLIFRLARLQSRVGSDVCKAHCTMVPVCLFSNHMASDLQAVPSSG